MQKWLISYYLQPESTLFIIFNYLNSARKKVIASISILLLAYPSFKIGLHLQQQNDLTQQIAYLIQDNQQKQTQLAQLTPSIQLEDNRIAHENDFIQKTLAKYQAKIENIQWQLSPRKRLYLQFSQTMEKDIEVVTQLIKQMNIEVEQVTFSNLYQPPFIQTYVQLIFNENKGE